GHRRALALEGMESATLTVVASKHPDAARELARAHGGRAVRHWRDAIAAEDVDAVVVCTPPDSHHEITLAAVAAGRHVLCEKPMARTSTEAAEMARAGEGAGIVVACGFNHRFHPALQRLREALTNGTLGAPYALRCAYGIAGRPGYEREWRCDPAVVSGGHLMEQGIHAVDLAQWLLGPVTEVTAACATSSWPIAPLEDNAVVLLRVGNVLVDIHSSLTQWVNLFRLELCAEQAVAVAEGLGGAYGDERFSVWRRTDGPFAVETTTFRGSDQSWRRELDDFVRRVRDGEVSQRPHPGVTALGVVERAYQASRDRTWLTV
ncbi:MAG: Gfo/Idh/MocA family oxidoreductase, partial [Sporichthyaceae bacterium]|nr:Gfo/Idh/MocA family oxidoreductase [Sporichthyaceae bacterium]